MLTPTLLWALVVPMASACTSSGPDQLIGDTSETERETSDVETDDGSDLDTADSEGLGCDVELLDITAASTASAACTDHGNEGYACYCDESALSVEGVHASTCDDALVAACGVEFDSAVECDQARAVCRRLSDDEVAVVASHDAGAGNAADAGVDPKVATNSAWACLCDEKDLRLVDTNGGCYVAALAACGESCSGRSGSCEPNALEGVYTCDCELYGTRRVRENQWAGYSCQEVLTTTCKPGHGLYQWGSCTSEAGYCDQPAPDEPVWQCTCLDGSEKEVQLSKEMVEPEPDCGVALSQARGEPAPPEACSVENEVGSGSCERAEAAEAERDSGEGALAFTCSCSHVCEHGAGDSAGIQYAANCAQALARFCGEDGPTCPK